MTSQGNQPELLEFLASPEVRADRRELRAGEFVGFKDGLPRGRKHPELPVASDAPRFIDEDQLISFAKIIQTELPLFTEFNNHARIEPTEQSIYGYCVSGNISAMQKRRQMSQNGTLKPLTQQEIRAMQRQTFYIGDQLQQYLFTEQNIAKLRRASLSSVRRQIENEENLDDLSAMYSADATRDFGYSVWLNATKKDDSGKTIIDESFAEMGNTIYGIGKLAEQDHEILRSNPSLLKLVQLEQKAHYEYWSVRLEATKEYLGDRLTKQQKAHELELDTEISRFETLGQ